MTTAPRVSIGMPVYNGERYLRDAIHALLGQTYADFELVISDNASTDGTAAICEYYQRRDPRIRYFRQRHNIGLSPNLNFVIDRARGEFFKAAHHDDLCARELVERCIEALDRHPEAVLAYTGSATIDGAGTVQHLVVDTTSAEIPRTPDRFRSMLIDGWKDYYGGVVRLPVLRRVNPQGSYHFADRVFLTDLGLHGPFLLVPECLHFRRVHSEQAGRRTDVRERCAILDPRRGDRMRHPVIRLYGEYLMGYVRGIRNAPLSPSERRECYWNLAKWTSLRASPVLGRTIRREGLAAEPPDDYRDLTTPLSLSPGSWLGEQSSSAKGEMLCMPM